jgi:hypothetical protein
LEFIREKFFSHQFQPFAFDHHVVIEATVFFVRTGVDLKQAAIGTKLHPGNLLTTILFQSFEGKLRYPKTLINLAAYGIHDHEQIAACSTPPTWNCVMASKLHFRIRPKTNHGSVRTRFLSDDGRCRLATVDVFDWILRELGAAYFDLRRQSLLE